MFAEGRIEHEKLKQTTGLLLFFEFLVFNQIHLKISVSSDSENRVMGQMKHFFNW